MKHPHLDLLVRAAADTTQQIWFWKPRDEQWTGCGLEALVSDVVGRFVFVLGDKPTAPPQRMCTLGGLQFPEPMTEAPKRGSRYWEANPGGCLASKCWSADTYDDRMLTNRLIHSTEAAAIAHSEALRAANLEAVRGAK